ncbi:DUF1232 domain-containing protein, partial [bacterium]|nr:DUF1232 domain-containing protein [bacterium]
MTDARDDDGGPAPRPPGRVRRAGAAEDEDGAEGRTAGHPEGGEGEAPGGDVRLGVQGAERELRAPREGEDRESPGDRHPAGRDGRGDRVSGGTWRDRVRVLKRDAYALVLAYRDRRTPWYAKATALVVAAYAFSPIDLIPDFIPVLGLLDDLVLVPLGVVLVRRMVPADVGSGSSGWRAWSRSPRGCTSPTGPAPPWRARPAPTRSSRRSARPRCAASRSAWTSGRIAPGTGGRCGWTSGSGGGPRRPCGGTPTPRARPVGASGSCVPTRRPPPRS